MFNSFSPISNWLSIYCCKCLNFNQESWIWSAWVCHGPENCRHVLDESPGACEWVIIPPLFRGCVSIISCVRIWFTKLVHLSSYLWECAKCPQLQRSRLTSFPAHPTHQYRCKLGEATSCKSAVNTHQGERHWPWRAASPRAAAHPCTGLCTPSFGKREYFSAPPPAGRSPHWKARLCTHVQKHLCELRHPRERVNGTLWWTINNLTYSWPISLN